MAILHIFRDDDKYCANCITSLGKGVHYMGRDNPIKSSDKRISRKHAIVVVEQNRAYIKSVNEKYTFFKNINGTVQLLNEQKSITLNDGDKFAFIESCWFKVKIVSENVDTSSSISFVAGIKRKLEEQHQTVKLSVRHVPEIEPDSLANVSQNILCPDLPTTSPFLTVRNDLLREDILTLSSQLPRAQQIKLSARHVSEIEPDSSANVTHNILCPDLPTTTPFLTFRNDLLEEDILTLNSQLPTDEQPDLTSTPHLQPITINIQNISNGDTLQETNIERPDLTPTPPLLNLSLVSTLPFPITNIHNSPNSIFSESENVERLDLAPTPPLIRANLILLQQNIENEILDVSLSSNFADSTYSPNLSNINYKDNQNINLPDLKVASTSNSIFSVNENVERPDLARTPSQNSNTEIPHVSVSSDFADTEQIAQNIKTEIPEVDDQNIKGVHLPTIKVKIENPEDLLHLPNVKTENNDQNINEMPFSMNEVKTERSESLPHLSNIKTEDNTQNRAIEVQMERTDQNMASLSNIRRDRCWYAGECYRKNPLHLQTYTHPGDIDYQPNESNIPCPYGLLCYRRNPLHRRQYKHYRKPAPRPYNMNVYPQRCNCSNNIHTPGYSCNEHRHKPDYESDYDEADM